MATPKMDLFANKEMVSLRIENRAAITSTLPGPTEESSSRWSSPPRSSSCASWPTTVRRRQPDRSGAGENARCADHRPPDKQPASDDANAPGVRGATAFEWHRQLVYVESTHRADMTGAVRVVHLDEDSNQPPVELDAEHG